MNLLYMLFGKPKTRKSKRFTRLDKTRCRYNSYQQTKYNRRTRNNHSRKNHKRYRMRVG